MPLFDTAAKRVLTWLESVKVELKRVADQDEWDEASIPRLVLDRSCLVRKEEFGKFNWGSIVGGESWRMIVPILVVRELDNLKNTGKEPKARRRVHRIYELLNSHGRGPAEIRTGITIELLMDPPRHVPLAVNDEEIISRTRYLVGRPGGPLRLISGDYGMVLSAQAQGLDAQLTSAELKDPVV